MLKKNNIVLLFCFFSYQFYSQTIPINSRLLSNNEISELFKESVKKELGIRFKLFKTFQYKDTLGIHYLVLTENEYIKEGKNTLNDSIKAIDVLSSNNKLTINWTINDFINSQKNKEPSDINIWFWTKYVQLLDLDKDGIIDPIIVYGTSSKNGTSEGRVKIITIYKNKKSVIRHQNSDMDFDRNTQVDQSFYLLPNQFQTKVKEIIVNITTDGNAIFPYGWQKNMLNKKLKFDESTK